MTSQLQTMCDDVLVSRTCITFPFLHCWIKANKPENQLIVNFPVSASPFSFITGSQVEEAWGCEEVEKLY